MLSGKVKLQFIESESQVRRLAGADLINRIKIRKNRNNNRMCINNCTVYDQITHWAVYLTRLTVTNDQFDSLRTHLSGFGAELLFIFNI